MALSSGRARNTEYATGRLGLNTAVANVTLFFQRYVIRRLYSQPAFASKYQSRSSVKGQGIILSSYLVFCISYFLTENSKVMQKATDEMMDSQVVIPFQRRYA